MHAFSLDFTVIGVTSSTMARSHLVILCSIVLLASSEKRVHMVHWDKSNPMFRIDNTDNVIDVNVGNTRWEYDQANFICPTGFQGRNSVNSNAADSEGAAAEKYIIYNVSKEEFDSCMVTSPSSRIVATCTDPSQKLYFTITFRSFTPTPGGLEFHPGQDYYFITTSVPGNVHGKFGGRCASHNMKVIFKVANSTRNWRFLNQNSAAGEISTTTEKPQLIFNEKNKYYPVVNEQSEQEKTLETAKKVLQDFTRRENEVILKQEASRMHNIESSAGGQLSSVTFLILMLWSCCWAILH